MILWKFGQSANINLSSASPLNGEAALLWDSNQEDFKRKVLARHVEPSELEDN
jgi:ubiquitin-conjugating enzyme E2 C